MSERELSTISLDKIVAPPGRDINVKAVEDIASSISSVGLQNPVSLLAQTDGTFRVISGQHRLAAVRSLGLEEIDAQIYRGLSDIEIRLAEIAENLHRAELTALERANKVTEYAQLIKQQREERMAQVGPHASNVKGASGRERGDRAAARKLNISRQQLQRSEKIANIAPAAKAAAKEVGLDDNQADLLKVSAAPEEQQVKIVREIADSKLKKRRSARGSKDAPTIGHARTVVEVVDAILATYGVEDVTAIIVGLNKELLNRTVAVAALTAIPRCDIAEGMCEAEAQMARDAKSGATMCLQSLDEAHPSAKIVDHENNESKSPGSSNARQFQTAAPIEPPPGVELIEQEHVPDDWCGSLSEELAKLDFLRRSEGFDNIPEELDLDALEAIGRE